jgi:hypothetical protein
MICQRLTLNVSAGLAVVLSIRLSFLNNALNIKKILDKDHRGV